MPLRLSAGTVIHEDIKPVAVSSRDPAHVLQIYIFGQFQKHGFRDLPGRAGGLAVSVIGRANPHGSRMRDLTPEVLSAVCTGDKRRERVRRLFARGRGIGIVAPFQFFLSKVEIFNTDDRLVGAAYVVHGQFTGVNTHGL